MGKRILSKKLVIGLAVLLLGAGVTTNTFVITGKANINEGLVGYWSFDDENNPAKDNSGNGHDGTLYNGAYWIDQGFFGGAIQFDGINDYISVPDHSDLDLHYWTISAFIYKYPGGWDSTVVSKGEDPSTDRFNYWMPISEEGSADYLWGAFEDVVHDDPNKGVKSSPIYDLDNNWHHIVFTRDEDKYSRLYYDGELVGEQYYDFIPAYANAPLYFGAFYNKPSGLQRYFNGTIDELRIYNRALSQEEIQDLLGPIEISLDIKPGSYPNSVNPKSNGKLPIAILTTEDFDGSLVDPVSINFLSASPVMWAMEDVDEDGDMDMILHFKIKELDFSLLVDEGGEYPYAYLNGETIDAQSIEGKDTVRLVSQWELLIENIYTEINEIIQWIIQLIIS